MLTVEQLEARYEGIGASEAASCAALPGAYYTARELYHIKRREIEPRQGDDLLTFLGHQMEPPLAEWYTRQTGRKVQRLNATQYHPDLPWMMAHIDRRCVGKRIRRGLEIKTRAHTDGWGPPGTDQVEDAVLLQVQHQMAVMDWPVIDVICLFRGVDARIYTVPRDDTLIASLIDQEGDFWHRVQTGEPPDHDYEHNATLALIDKLHPATDGKVMQLPGEFMSWHEVLEDSREHIRRYEAVKKSAQAHIKDALGDAAVGFLPDGSSYARAERHRTYHNAEGEQRSSFMALTYNKPPRTRS